MGYWRLKRGDQKESGNGQRQDLGDRVLRGGKGKEIRTRVESEHVGLEKGRKKRTFQLEKDDYSKLG